MLRALASGDEPGHPVLAAPGWWRRPERLLYPPVDGPRGALAPAAPARTRSQPARPVVILGATGTLGREFARLCAQRGLPCALLSRRELDLTEDKTLAEPLDRLRPWAVVNAAGYTRVEDAERRPELCRRVNADGPARLAAACARRGIALLAVSSDLVFDGDRAVPYGEGDAVAPLNAYGRSKAEMETRVREAHPGALVVRTGPIFGPWDGSDSLTIALRTLASGHRLVAADDAITSPTYVPDLVHAALDLLIDGERGLWHLANAGAITWADLARRAAALAGLDPEGVEGRPTSLLGPAAPRPRYSVLGSERGALLPTLDDALARYLCECPHSPAVCPVPPPLVPGVVAEAAHAVWPIVARPDAEWGTGPGRIPGGGPRLIPNASNRLSFGGCVKRTVSGRMNRSRVSRTLQEKTDQDGSV
jgi:dTDP-4-dehydrorhamnose reductase